MAITRKALAAWVNAPGGGPDDMIGIEDGGLTLVHPESGEHIEVGGIPHADGSEPAPREEEYSDVLGWIAY
jgi:hypothetical protein